MYKFCFSFLVGVAILGGVVASYAQQPQEQPPQEQPQYGAILTVKHMCCARESVPAIKELSKVAGVKRVAVSYKTRSLYIETTNITPSPQSLWDAADRINIGPVRLATTSGVYTSRPE